jgi:tryptophan-rich sensory protein
MKKGSNYTYIILSLFSGFFSLLCFVTKNYVAAKIWLISIIFLIIFLIIDVLKQKKK